mmetsp:Transcript_94972/g.305769  ORF Transcript_94972/g.305769 Transcript_94972/m.305769 type:complete len:319 (-) Transcript_94972:219-1175(-)
MESPPMVAIAAPCCTLAVPEDPVEDEEYFKPLDPESSTLKRSSAFFSTKGLKRGCGGRSSSSSPPTKKALPILAFLCRSLSSWAFLSSSNLLSSSSRFLNLSFSLSASSRSIRTRSSGESDNSPSGGGGGGESLSLSLLSLLASGASWCLLSSSLPPPRSGRREEGASSSSEDLDASSSLSVLLLRFLFGSEGLNSLTSLDFAMLCCCLSEKNTKDSLTCFSICCPSSSGTPDANFLCVTMSKTSWAFALPFGMADKALSSHVARSLGVSLRVFFKSHDTGASSVSGRSLLICGFRRLVTSALNPGSHTGLPSLFKVT